MSKIAFLAADDAVASLIKKSLANILAPDDEVIITPLQFADIISQGRQLVKDGIQVIVTSGGTYSDLCRAIDAIPIIQLSVSTSDILYTLGKIKNADQPVYLLLNERILFDHEKCRDVMDKSVTLFRYNGKQELSSLIEKLSADKNGVIVGSGLVQRLTSGTVNTIAIMPSESTIISVYQYARDLAQLNSRDSYRVSVLEAILSNIDDGIIFINNKKKIVHINERAAEFLNLKKGQIPSLKTLFPDLITEEMAFPVTEHLIYRGNYTLVAHVSNFSANYTKEYIIILKDVSKLQALENSVRVKLTQKGLTAAYTFTDIHTKNKTMKEIIKTAKTISNYDFPVLIQGESGTGKELFAQSIHNASLRRNGPFIAINCAALPENILESELFGYVAGAFTGARKEGKAGLFELAHQGTIFLDEINSMSLHLQSKLLRILDTKEVMRLGSDYIIPLNIRILSASNSNLAEEVRNGRFRKDLFFRLNSFTLKLPSLNERKEDIVHLFRLFVAKRQNKRLEEIRLDDELATLLQRHNWWGNIRELAGAAEKYLIWRDKEHYSYLFNEPDGEHSSLANSSLIGDDLQIDMKELSSTIDSLIIQSLLDKGLSKIQVARLFGISRQTLFNKLKNHPS